MRPGAYSVSETGFVPGLAQCAGFDGGQQISSNIYACTDFSDDCSGNMILLGQVYSCNIENHFVIEENDTDFSVASSHIIAHDTQDSPGLTALEKIAKLKQQWLELLP